MSDGQEDFDRYPKPSLAVDPVLMTVTAGELGCVVWRRPNPPCEGMYALPGVFVNKGEELDEAVHRALRTKVGLRRRVACRQMFAWNKTDRDVRGWVVTIAYVSVAEPELLRRAVSAREDCMLAQVHERSGALHLLDDDGEPLELALGHDEILHQALQTLRDEIWTTHAVLGALPELFTLRDMRTVYEAVLGTTLNKDSFRRRVTRTASIVRGTGTFQEQVGHRPAELFTPVT